MKYAILLSSRRAPGVALLCKPRADSNAYHAY